MRKTNPLVSDDSVTTIIQIASAFEQSKILLSACELDIFSILGNDEKSAIEIAIEAKTDEKATTKLLNALVSMNLLSKSGQKYSNTKGTRKFLVKNRPEYIGNMMYLTHQWNKWNDLSEAVRNGKAVTYKDISEKSNEWVQSYIESMHWRAVLQAPDVIKLINLNEVNSVLDLGCGSGVYAMQFLREKPSLKVTALDFENVIPFTKHHTDRENMTSKINIIGGDAFKTDFGKGYDLVFISSMLTYYSLWENIDLLHKIYNSLNPKGCLVIQENLINDNRVEPETSTILSLNMLVNTKSGDVFTETDLWMILREGWFTNVKRIDTVFDTSLMIGYK